VALGQQLGASRTPIRGALVTLGKNACSLALKNALNGTTAATPVEIWFQML
jgi:hypothetical protein